MKKLNFLRNQRTQKKKNKNKRGQNYFEYNYCSNKSSNKKTI